MVDEDKEAAELLFKAFGGREGLEEYREEFPILVEKILSYIKD